MLARDLSTPIIAGDTILLLTTEGGAYDGNSKHGDRKGVRSWESLPGSPAAGQRIARLTGQLSYIMRTCGKTIIANL